MRILFPSFVHEHRRQPPNLFAVRPDGTGPTRLTHFSDAPAGMIGAVWAADGTHTAQAQDGGRQPKAAAAKCRRHELAASDPPRTTGQPGMRRRGTSQR
jgi:hypothetical protein